MIVFDNNNEAVIIESIYTPTNVDHIWVLDLDMMDFTLTQLMVLEEVISPSIELMIQGFKFVLPANWNIMVTDEETMQLDVVEVSELAGKEFKALVYGPNLPLATMEVIRITNYHPNYRNVGPSLNKHQLLCHPISSTSWVNVAPSDSYNKYLKNISTGDII